MSTVNTTTDTAIPNVIDEQMLTSGPIAQYRPARPSA
jgi:hypothetical protein